MQEAHVTAGPRRARRWVALTAALGTFGLAFAGLPGSAGAVPVEPEPIVVTTSSGLADPGDGLVSLRGAVALANQSDDPDVITFADGVPNGIDLGGGELVVTHPLTIVGGSTAGDRTLGALDHRHFHVQNTSLTLRAMTLASGHAVGDGGSIRAVGSDLTLEHVTVRSSAATGAGGGIAQLGGTLTLGIGTVVRHNVASTNGGGVHFDGTEDPTALLTITGASIHTNNASGAGGGVATTGGAVAISENAAINYNTAASGGGLRLHGLEGPSSIIGTSVIDNETLAGDGGGGGGVNVDDLATSLTITRSVVSANSSNDTGAGIRVQTTSEGTLTVERSLVSGNIAGNVGGGIAVTGEGELFVTSSTLSGNQASSGGGLYGGEETSTTARHATIVKNTATESGGNVHLNQISGHRASLVLDHTIVADGTAPGSLYQDVAGGGDIELAWSLVEAGVAGHGVSLRPDTTNLIGVDPLLDALPSGYDPHTHALLAGSPAIDAGDPAIEEPPTTDQVGNDRIRGARIDIGAFEAPASAPETATLTVTPATGGRITSSPAGIDCGSTCTTEVELGTFVDLTAAASPGYTFAGWTGCGHHVFGKALPAENECFLYVDGDVTVGATFTRVGPSTPTPSLPPIFTPPTTTAPPVPEGPTVTPPGQPVAVPTRECPTDGRFGDTAGNRHERNIDCAAWWGITVGQDETTYGPGFDVTRGQVASFLVRLLGIAGETLEPGDDLFGDDQGTTHEEAINALAAAGIAFGRTDSTFGAEVTITRGQFLSLLVQAYEHRTGTTLPTDGDHFGDDDGNVHETSIEKAYALGLTVGRAEGVFAPDAALTRDEAATFLMRVLDLLGGDGLVLAR